jgi:hypothetical protein
LLDSLRRATAAAAAVAFVVWSHQALADTEREKALADRIKYLEERLERVERLLNAEHPDDNAPARRAAQSTPAKPKATPIAAAAKQGRHAEPATSVATAPPAPTQTAANEATAASPAAASPAAASAPAAARSPDPADEERDAAPQELNVLRENAVTLKPAGIEVSSEISYTERQGSLQRDRAVIDNTTVRYGLLNWLELSASLPIGFTTRTSDTSPFSSVTYHASGVGDFSFQANARVLDQTDMLPGTVISLGFIAPTGPSPFDFSHYSLAAGGAVQNPRNPLIDYFSQGSWGFHSNLQFYKTVDPLILFFGLGLDHVFPASNAGFTVDGYNRFNYNFGLSFALSEKTTLGFSVNGSYYPDLKVNGRTVFQTAQEPTIARLTLSQRLRRGWYLEPSMAFGLNQDSPDYIIGMGVRADF